MDSLVMESRIQPLKEMGTMYKWGSKNKWHIRFTSQARCYSLHKGKDADFTGPCEQSFCRQQQFTITGTLMMVCDKWITGTLVNAILIKSQSIVGTKLILFRDAYILNHKKKNKKILSYHLARRVSAEEWNLFLVGAVEEILLSHWKGIHV